MIVRNSSLCSPSARQEVAVHDGHQKVFNHHVYEYRKGLRDLALQTLPREHEGWVIARLDDLDVAYLIYPVGKRHINVFMGWPECVAVVRRIGKFDLSRYTPEEDFILGVMPGYGRRQQVMRYLDLLHQGDLERESEMSNERDRVSPERSDYVCQA